MIKLYCVILVAVLLAPMAFSVPVAPEIVEMLKQSGQFDKFVQANVTARDKGVWEANPDPIRFGLTTELDTLHCIVILVDFDDMPYTAGNFAATPEQFDSLLFSRGLFAPGSAADYYFEVSYGQALLIGEITNWYRMPQSSAYYADGQRGFGYYPQNAQRLAEDAVIAADPDIDFEPYDNNDDGMVDGLFVVHAGPGYENSGNLNHIHSHAWATSYDMQTNDDVYISSYSMEPEESGGNDMVHIGVFCHEFGHVLGLPDLYDYGYDSDGVGSWSIMSGGVWSDNGRTPVHFDAWCKMALGWINPHTCNDNVSGERIDAVEYSPDIYQIYSQGTPFPQYWLVENRQRRLFDAYLPGDGLLIYHIDDTVPNNDDQTRYKVAVEQADGDFDLENNRGGDSGDPWPGSSNNRSFDDWSTPNSHFYIYGLSEIAVSNISDSDSSMTADLYIMYDMPLYELLEVTFDDSEGGNDDGRVDAGETCNLIFRAQNVRTDADNLIVIASVSDDLISFTDSISTFGNLPIYQEFDNNSDIITFSVPQDYSTGFVTFTLTFSANNGSYQQHFEKRIVIGMPEIMLMDDDNGDSLETYYMDALDELGKIYDIYDISQQGPPSSAIANFPYLIWFTGDTRSEPMSSEAVDFLIQYLENGGHLLMTSQDFAQNLAGRGDTDDMLLLNDYLKIDYNQREINHAINGAEGTRFEGMHFLDGGNDGASNQISQDALTMSDGGTLLLSYSTGRIAAVGVSNQDYAAMTIGFGIESINNSYPDYDKRVDIISAAIDFLFHATSIDNNYNPLPSVTSLVQNYPNPFNAKTTISFELAQTANVSLEIFDILGRRIETLVNEELPAGNHHIIWDATNVSSGIYFYRLKADAIEETKRMLLIK